MNDTLQLVQLSEIRRERGTHFDSTQIMNKISKSLLTISTLHNLRIVSPTVYDPELLQSKTIMTIIIIMITRTHL